jgi:protein phosphatase
MLVKGNSDVGKVRTANEDSFDYDIFDDGTAWAVVCDGMGGVRGGQIASSLATEMVGDKIRKCYNKLMPVYSFENIFLSTITTANVIVNDRSYTDTEFQGMGTTIAAAIVKDDQVCIAHVGDSRVYCLRNKICRQLTVDHTLQNELCEKGLADPQNLPGSHIISRAVRGGKILTPELHSYFRSPDDRYLLCSDGLTNCWRDDEIGKVIMQAETPRSATDTFIRGTLRKGAGDNVTVLCVFPENSI